MPILVMSPSALTFESLIKNGLEPDLYSIQILSQFIEAARGLRHYFDEINIHLKIDSGMHRLGFEQKDLDEVFSLLKSAPFLKVASVFTHLSAADDPTEIDFSNQQISVFQSMADQLDASLGYKPMRHALNSSGVLRFPNYQFDMVRLGIGLYGFVGTEHSKYLKALGVFKSYIIQIRTVAASESVGYSRGGKHSAERRIATVGVGYADGLDRRLGNGNWSLKWQGQNCPIVGNVCMDMVMIDVTNCAAREGDQVLIFEGSEDIQKMADLLETIPYEILTKVSQRVRRVYLQE